MKRFVSIIALTALCVMPAAAAAGQSRTIPGQMKTVTGTVDAVDHSLRTITLKTGNETRQIDVPAEVKGFSNVKVGDRLTLRYYDNVVLVLKKPGEPDVDRQGGGVTPGTQGTSGTIARQRTVTATIASIDEKASSITFTGPEKLSYTAQVKDRAALSKVKVGDKVDITFTTAVVASLEPAP